MISFKKKKLYYCRDVLLWKVVVHAFLLVTRTAHIRMVHSYTVASTSVAENLSATSTPRAATTRATTAKTEFKPTPVAPTMFKTSSSATTIRTSAAAAGTFIDSTVGSGSVSIGIPNLEKEVVETLIKRWAPLVWLAPEEKFMPLGVDEFLRHVHPVDKSKSIINGIPMGDNSMKAYLVTNTEIAELLENNTSFLYGRDPNESSVPIYALASVCTASGTETANDFAAERIYSKTPTPSSPPYQLTAPIKEQQQLKQTSPREYSLLQSTRSPYIPIYLHPINESNNTIRRASRLYPYFKKIGKRDVSSHLPLQSSLGMRQSGAFATPGLQFVMGKAGTDNKKSTTNEAGAQSVPADTVPTPPPPPPDTSTSQVNNFIANLADNVRFTEVSDEFDNNINTDNMLEQLSEEFRFKKEVPSFHVTYWLFYPYSQVRMAGCMAQITLEIYAFLISTTSQGKTMCTLSLGPLGHIPFPAVYGFCLGSIKDIGSHIGDWEHMSLFFNGAAEPEAMYVSAHDAGAYYTYNRLTGSFEFKEQETRKGILQRPNFPKTVTTFNNHPVLFAAKGSHGLWTAPGKHRFVKVARLYDVNGFGTPWKTWKAVDITYDNLKSHGSSSSSLMPSWLAFKGKWGNPKSKCHPFQGIGLNFCEYTDGPTGIPLKQPHFQCDTTDRFAYI